MENIKIKETDILIRFLASETNAAENERVQNWIEESTQNKNYFLQVKALWDTIDPTLDEKYQTNDAFKKILPNITVAKKSFIQSGIFKKLAIAASILILFGAGIGFYVLQDTNKEIVVSSNQKIAKVTFPDNSVVWLNKNSKLVYYKNYRKNRRIHFIGEGYFEVKPDAAHPFVISTTNSQITVLGTKFNVLAYPDDSSTIVVVTSGKVKLTDISSKDNNIAKEVVLVKGEKGVIANQSLSPTKKPADDPNYMSWKTHEFVFNNTNITEIVKLVSDIYDAEIKIENTNTENCNLTGRYSCYSLDDMLDMLKIVLNISVEKNGNYILIKTNDC